MEQRRMMDQEEEGRPKGLSHFRLGPPVPETSSPTLYSNHLSFLIFWLPIVDLWFYHLQTDMFSQISSSSMLTRLQCPLRLLCCLDVPEGLAGSSFSSPRHPLCSELMYYPFFRCLLST